MANPFLGTILGSVLGQAMGRGTTMGGGPLGGGGIPGGLGGVLGGMLGGSMAGRMGGPGRGVGGRNALLALMLPLAMQWIQRNGGIGNVLQRAQQRGYSRQASSWVGTGENEALPLQAVDELVGHDEIVRLSQQLGVGEQEVSEGFAEILPEMVDKLSPDGMLPEDADQVLDAGQSSLERMLAAEDERQPIQ